MGQTQSILYSVEVPGQEQPQDSTKIRRHPDFVQGLIDSPDEQLKTLQAVFKKNFLRFAHNDCIGQIVTKPGAEPGKEKREVKYKTYQQVSRLADSLDKAIYDMKLSPEIQEVPGLKLRFVGIFSKNRRQWLQVDVMCVLKGYCLVPIYDTLGAENIPYVLNHTNLTTLFCSGASVDILLKCDNLGAVKDIVSFDPVEEDIIAKYKEKGVTVSLYCALAEKYEKSDIKPEVKTLKPDDVVAFCYTSGTTGPPKGAMLSERNFAAYAAVLAHNPALHMTEEDTHISYLPLAHILQNVCVLAMLVFGGRICPYSGDVKNLKNDLELVKPTIFMSVPRLYNRFYEAVKDKFNKTQGWSKTILDRALESKMYWVHQTGDYANRLYDKVVFNKTKQLFGGQCRLMASGSAPLTPEVHSFMKVIGCAPLIEGYGQTESTGVSFFSAPKDPQVGHVGGPTSMVEYKLLDIPQMKYTHKDKDEQGRPMPRGQILIRGPGVFVGYYKDEAKTKETINQDGWLHTGDVGTITPDTKALKLIDRKKNIFKLQQGEYVASQKVESVYSKKEDMVQEIFLHGDSSQSFCVAIIVPVKSAIESIAKTKNVEGSYEEVCNNKDVRTEYLTQLNTFSKKQGLHGFQQPKNVYLQTTSFQQKNLMTSTLKLQRFTAKTTYKEQIDAMYKEGVLGGKSE